MSSAIASLERRLAKGGGSAEDWELLAKSYDFLGQPDNAAKARAHQLPPAPPDDAAGGVSPPAQVLAKAASATAPALSKDSLQWLDKAAAARKEQKFADAAAIYAQLAARGQMNAESWADYADSAASVQGKKLAGAPEQYIAKALALEPTNPKALWLKASAAEEGGRFGEGAAALQTLLGELDPKSADAKIVSASLQQDQKMAATEPGAASPAAVTASRTSISGEVSLAPALKSKVSPGSILFIVAKSVDSPGMPVAVRRVPVDAWPVPFTLDDSLAMMPGRTLSTAGRVSVEARISATGQAMPAAGDLQGTTAAFSPAGHVPLKIQIDQVVK